MVVYTAGSEILYAQGAKGLQEDLVCLLNGQVTSQSPISGFFVVGSGNVAKEVKFCSYQLLLRPGL